MLWGWMYSIQEQNFIGVGQFKFLSPNKGFFFFLRDVLQQRQMSFDRFQIQGF